MPPQIATDRPNALSAACLFGFGYCTLAPYRPAARRATHEAMPRRQPPILGSGSPVSTSVFSRATATGHPSRAPSR